MQNSLDSDDLTPPEWVRLREWVDRFEEVCKQQNDVDLADFLPPLDDPLRPDVLLELICTDLELRYRRGSPILLEEYLRRFPELGGASTFPVSLLLEEYRHRRGFGQPVSLDDYRARFPQRFGELERLMHQASFVADERATCSFPRDSRGAAETARTGQLLPMDQGYRLVEIIGKGASAVVWKALAPGDFPAAIKVIERSADSDEINREYQSLELLKHLRHRALLRITAAWPLPDQLIIAHGSGVRHSVAIV